MVCPPRLACSVPALVGFAAFLFSSSLAHAHAGTSGAQGFIAGILHPFGGLDHILAPVAVGLWAVQQGKRAVLYFPLTFAALMFAGSLAGASGSWMPYLHPAVPISLVVLGAIVATASRPPLFVSLWGLGLFGALHGYVHGLDIPAHGSAFAYGTGVAVTTALLHGVAIGASLLASAPAENRFVRASGAAIAIAPVLTWIAA